MRAGSFLPSKSQQAYLDCWLDPMAPKNIGAIAKQIDVSRRTVQTWLIHAGFQTWFNAEVHAATEHLWGPALHKVAALAIAGSPEHFKLLAIVRGAIRTGGDGQADRGGVTVVVGIPRPGDNVEGLTEAPARPSLPPARSDSEH